MKQFSKIIGFFLLTTILLLKVSSLHAFSHDDNADDGTDCAICHISLEEQQQITLLNSDFKIEFESPYIFNYSLPATYEVIKDNKHIRLNHSRPPPTKLFFI